MDAGKSYHSAYTHQQSGNMLYGMPTLQAQRSLHTIENSPSGWWSPDLYSTAPYSAPSFLSDNQQYFNTTSDFYTNSIGGLPFSDTNYATPSFADCLPKNGDFPQDSAYLNELSSNSLFSSPADSLSDIADAQEFLHADSLSRVPTIWDVSTPQQNQIEKLDYELLSPTESCKLGKQHPDRVVETSTLSSVPPPDVTYILSLPESIGDNGLLSALQLEAITYACQIKYGDTATSEGVLFATYSALIGESQAGGQHRTRLKQILDWCKEDFDGVIVFDECHKAKNASSTKMGKAVLDLQNKLPRARVVYASATGASEPKNMIYMSRLGIWGDGTPFRSFDEFLHAIEKRGVGAMEIVAMDMKVSGMYIARQLSFSGVTFRIEEIPLDPEYEHVYNKAAQLWAEALVVFQQAADLIGLESRKSLWGQFWSAHQRFFKYLCIAAKVRRLVELAKEELSKDRCVVIGLQSTGEARTREVLDENEGHLNCFVSAAEGVFLSLIQKHFPSTKRKRERGTGIKRKRKQRVRCGTKVPKSTYDLTSTFIKISSDSSSDSEPGLESDFNSSPESLFDNDDVIVVEPGPTNGFVCEDRGGMYMQGSQKEMQGPGALEHVERVKQDLLLKVKALGKELPLNTLDELIDHFGGPEHVAEMTGRKGRVVRQPDGSVVFETRAEPGLSIDNVNLKEKERFMNGDKVRTHRHSGKQVQEFGLSRTHRSNQVSAPEYIFLISELAGERRFASIVAKRLESLGALTHGDRRATESRDLSKYNFENKYGSRALDRVLLTILNQTENKVPVPKSYDKGDTAFFQEMKQCLLSVGICCKEMRYGFVTVEKDLAPGVDEIYEESKEIFLTPGHPQDGQVVFYKISVDRGIKWEEAYEKSLQLTGLNEGFYLSHKVRGSKYTCLLAEQNHEKHFTLYKPNIGKHSQLESLESLHRKYQKVSPEEAKEHWENNYAFSLQYCNHAVWNGHCKAVQEGKECFQGTRLRHYYMLCGALLRVWSKIAGIMADITNTNYLQIVRLKTKEKKKQVGIKIPESCVEQVRKELKQMDENVKQKQSQALLSAAAAARPNLPYPVHQQTLPLDLNQSTGSAGFLPSQPSSLQQDEILDLTYSPSSDGIPDLWAEASTQPLPPPPPLPPLHFGFSLPYNGGNLPLGSSSAHEHLPQALVPPLPNGFSLPSQDINYKEVLEEMLNSLNVGLEDSSAHAASAVAAPERQSVIQFSGPFPSFCDNDS
ncbi:hypothetical protein JD844_034087 [Phrynosoma platyrhinos]|uniref:Strawberry notch homolog 2 n=1 Tax=Phrynosoma platyrhinos TaxID=52577 RepID=A0ABQ7T8E7_PHRPL|nr:hypothetical protein JD844_034087 [Phrynosoma platyrhinos]